ncbi:uncharacterized protein LOC128549123 [Mercenaria mercenaria]|uniref:uncharacterized protein LOC128549123 n=1 Tax=Mercenaria mercenaria TaxID=6596 RepID=UPI00234F3B8C|nr:uncharacterized protein LOC128549123 [Mercenaria mercenaria]
MNVRNLRQSRKHKNYVSALVAVNKTSDALESVTEDGLRTVHNQIQQNLGHHHFPQCVQQCSRIFRDLNRWCGTCTSWRIELDAYMTQGARQNRIRWTDMKSWTWPVDERNIAEVFILPGWNTNNINLKDLSTTLAVWKRCSVFQRHVVQAAEPLKKNRNQLVHEYNASMKITNAKKIEIFQNIRNLITHPDIQPLIPNHNDLIRMIGELEQGDLFKYEDDIMNALRNIGMQNEDIQARLDRHALGLQEVHTKLDHLGRTIQHVFFRQNVLTVAFLFCLTVVIFSGLSYHLNSQKCELLENLDIRRNEHKFGFPEINYTLKSTEGCLAENFSSVDHGRVYLFEYISHHNNFTGRTWLFKIIEDELLFKSGEHHGLILEAGMGYGKSAVMKQIICSSTNNTANRIRSRLMAFHICRFDVTVSKQSYIFIFRLMAMFSAQMPDVGMTVRKCLEVFDRGLCEMDPNGCLDQCIIIPLKNETYSKYKPVIILIDGLDECYNLYRAKNEIFLLLKNRIHRFPVWVRFLISSRRGSEVRQLARYLRVITLDDDDFNNIQDIQLYLQKSNINTSDIKYTELAKSNLSNFLIASSLNNNFNFENGNIIPLVLDQYYDEQFRRQFEATSEMGFEDAKVLLEVICSSFQTLTEERLWNIIFTITHISKKVYQQTLKRLEPFMHHTESKLYFKHFSLQHWLLNNTNEDFHIDRANGHIINALYIFKDIDNANYNIDVVDLAIHVSYAKDENLVQRFLNLSETQRDELQEYNPVYPLIRLARRVDDFLSTDMLASHFKDIERLDHNNFPALFIAAYMGHLHTFEALVKRGANITFRTKSFHSIIDFESAFLVSFEHKFWGYGILDIAAQNGHAHLVNYIIKQNGNMFQYPVQKMNAANLLPIHLACKRGHINVVKLLHQKYPYMLDWLCLYYASEIGNKEFVEFILNKNLTDRCSRCESSIHWIPDKKLRVQGQIVSHETDPYEYVLFDDWNKIACESALHVAVRKHRLDVVKILIKQPKNAVNCFDRGGRTPLIVAIQYGYRDFVEYFASVGLLKGNETCGDVPLISNTFNLHENEVEKLKIHSCEPFMPIYHVAAKFNRLWLDEVFKLHNIKADWYSRDNNGCYPLHTAACHDNTEFLLFLVEKLEKDIANYKCHNGSTSLHSAVACASVSATEIVLLKYSNYATEPRDVKMSYLKHALGRNAKCMLAKEIETLERDIAIIVSMLLLVESDLYISGNLNRNVLHFSISNGHFGTVNYLYSRYSDSAMSLLHETDENGRDPLTYAIDNAKVILDFHLPSSIFENYNVFDEPLSLMGPEEYAILLTLNFLKSEISYQTFLERLVQKQFLHLVIYFLKLSKQPFEDTSTLSAILKNDRSGIITLVYYMISTNQFSTLAMSGTRLDISRMPFACSTCAEILIRCHTHEIALEYLKIAHILSTLNFDIINSIILNIFFHKSSAKILSNCYDESGYNVLERAIQGGSPQLVLHLLDFGVSSELRKDVLLHMTLNTLQYKKSGYDFIHVSKTLDDFLRISFVKHEHVLKEFNLFSRKSQYSNRTMFNDIFLLKYKASDFELITYSKNFTDWLLSILIRKYHSNVSIKQICCPKTKRFSFIHRLLFEGLLKSTKLAVKYWGPQILECRNADDFTPLYLYKIFHKTEAHFIPKYKITIIHPKKQPELYLLFHLQFRFFFSKLKVKHFDCLLKNYHTFPIHIYSLSKTYTCIRKINRMTKSKTVKILTNKIKWTLSFITEIDTWGKSVMLFMKMHGLYVHNTRLCELRWILDGIPLYESWKNDQNKYTDPNYAHFTRNIGLVNRMCGFLRKSYKKLILFFKENVKDGGDEYQNFAEILRNFDRYEWNVYNCTEIHIEWTRYIKPDVKIFVDIASRHTLISLKHELIGMALNQSIFLPFATKRLEFRKMLLNIHLRMHLFKHYSYMEELYNSQIFRESYMYKSQNLITFSNHVSHISQRIKFLQWQQNAKEIFDEFLERKDTNP